MMVDRTQSSTAADDGVAAGAYVDDPAVSPVAMTDADPESSDVAAPGDSGNDAVVSPQQSMPIPEQVTDDNSDQAMHAPAARSTYNVTGAGLKIGIISDSFNKNQHESQAQANGDLPYTVDVIFDDPQSGGTDEGQAMAELVYRIAPGALIDFCSGYIPGNEYDGTNGIAEAINSLVAQGCNVIVDDLNDYEQSFFEEGDPISQAVDAAVAKGVNYFTAGGNDGSDYYYSAWHTYAGTAPTGSSGLVLDVGNGTPFEKVSVTGKTYMELNLQWDQPIDGLGGYNTATLYRLNVAVYDASFNYLGTTTLYAGSDTNQPINVSYYYNSSSSTQTFYYVVYEPTSANLITPGVVKVVALNFYGTTINGYGSGVGSGTGDAQQLDPLANAVGAINYSATPAFGTAPPVSETFSAAGGSQFLFDGSGNRLATPVAANGPDFSAPDGGTVSAGSKFPAVFTGTSAAAPDAAAVSLLMLQEDSRLTTKQVTYLLEQSAISTGNATVGGAGLIQADVAVAASSTLKTTPIWTAQDNSASWTDALNWSDDAIPVSGTAVQLRNGSGIFTATYSVTYNQLSSTIGSLVVDGAAPRLTIQTADQLTTGSLTLGNGTIVVDGTLIDTGAQAAGSATGAVTLDATGRLSIAGAAVGSGIAYSGTGGQLVFGASDSPTLTSGLKDSISGFALGDTLDLSGLSVLSVAGVHVNGSDVTVVDATNKTLADLTLTGAFTSLSYAPDSTGGTTILVACYCPGTGILTDRGERAIETLAIGDVVVTASGAHRPVKWLGRRSYNRRVVAANPSLAPVRIEAGALGCGLPRRDLLVSGLHAMFLGGNLVNAEDLVNGTTIRRQVPDGPVCYIHLELDLHDVILAEGAPSETFLDTGNRHVFDNASEYAALYPEQANKGRFCAPRVEHGERMQAILDTLAA